MSIERALVVSWPDYSSGFPASAAPMREAKKKKKERKPTDDDDVLVRPYVVLYDYVKFAKEYSFFSLFFFFRVDF